MERRLFTKVTEPTTDDSGQWILSTFEYDDRYVLTEGDLRMLDSRRGLAVMAMRTQIRSRFYEWIVRMPPVNRFTRSLLVSNDGPSMDSRWETSRGVTRFRVQARGIFELGTESQMEALLKEVV